MSADKPVASADANGSDAADLAKVCVQPAVTIWGLYWQHQAFQELAKGEQTAAALESQLTAMEARIEAMLAEAEKNEAAVKAAQENGDKKAEGSSWWGKMLRSMMNNLCRDAHFTNNGISFGHSQRGGHGY
jgi:hypothetical protein